jgi:hypothetical protein
MEGTPIPPPLPTPDPALARSKVQAPAILLIVISALGLIISLWGFVGHSADQYAPLLANPELPEGMRNFVSGMATHGRWMSLPGIVLSGLVLFGALKMKDLRAYPLALTAAIIALIPCFGFNQCCCIGMPVGAWALYVLTRPEVKGAFRP